MGPPRQAGELEALARFATELTSRRRAPGESLVLLSTIDSTNSLARRIGALPGAIGDGRRVLVAALHQSAGRGRGGRTWSSSFGAGIYSSLLLDLPMGDLAWLPLAVSVALCGHLRRRMGLDCRLKWPNDLLVGGAKIGGILIETMGSGVSRVPVVIGYGVNCRDPEVKRRSYSVTSLSAQDAPVPPLGALCADLAAAVDRELRELDPEPLLERYAGFSVHRPGDVLRCRIDGGSVTGTFDGFDSTGRLRLRTGAEERLLSSGDVSQ